MKGESPHGAGLMPGALLPSLLVPARLSQACHQMSSRHQTSFTAPLLCPRLLETPEVRKERVVFKELDLWPQIPKSLENSEVLNIM